MMECPSRTDLRALLAGELTATQAAELERHVDTCEHCIRHLAEWTDTADIKHWKNLLTKPERDWKPTSIAPVVSDALPEITGYEVLRVLGRGGAATVYLARQISLNRLVALKWLHAGPNRDDTERLKIEAAAAAQLRHPNIVVVYEIGESDGRRFLTMEYLEQGTLAALAGRQPMPPLVAAKVMEQVARAVHFAHKAGIIHRDIKPSNILLETGDGCLRIPKVGDFGLARRLEQDSGLTNTRDLLGTPAYMAPELVLDAGRASPATDVYALGVVLYELLTGRPPFIGKTPLDTLLQARDHDPVPLRRLQPEIPVDLQTVCLKCLEKNPQARYTDAATLADDLQRFQAGVPVKARPISRLHQTWRWARRHRATAALLTLLSLIVLSGTIASLAAAGYFRNMVRQIEKLGDEKEVERASAVASRELAETQRNLALETLYYTQANLVGQSLTRDDGSQNLDKFFREWRGRSLKPDPRNWEWYYFESIRDQSERSLHGHMIDVLSLCWSPDGRRVASGGFDRKLRIWDAATGRQLMAATAEFGITHIHWTKDSRILALNASGVVQFHDSETGAVSRSLKLQHKIYAASSAEDRFATSDGIKVFVLDSDNHVLQTIETRKPPSRRVSFSPDSTRLAIQDLSGQLIVTDWIRGKTLWTSPENARIIDHRWSPDGKTLAMTDDSLTIRTYDTTTWQILKQFDSSARAAGPLGFSHDGRWLASSSTDQSLRIWDLESGTLHTKLNGHTHLIFTIAFHPSKPIVATGNGFWNGVVRIWSVNTPAIPSVLLSSPITAMCACSDSSLLVMTPDRLLTVVGDHGSVRRSHPLRCSPSTQFCNADGKYVFAQENEQTLAIRSAETAELLAKLPAIDTPIRRVAMSPDAKRALICARKPNYTEQYPFVARIFDVMTGQTLRQFDANAASWSPDGKYLAVGKSYAVDLLDASTMQTIMTWSTPDMANLILQFSPDSRRLAYLGAGNVIIRSLDEPSAIPPILSHIGNVPDLKWSPDGKRLATISDNAIHLWDSRSGQFILKLGDGEPISCVAWSKNGLQLFGAGTSGLRVWDASRGYELSKPQLRSTSCLLGWWVIARDSWNTKTEDPFSATPVPEWYVSANDPNGRVPIASRDLVYVVKAEVAAAGKYTIHFSSPVEYEIFHKGQLIKDSQLKDIDLQEGAHTYCVRIKDPSLQNEVSLHPGAGFYFRMEPSLR